MNVLAPLPAANSASGRFYKLCARVLKTASKRHQSSYRRTRRRLNIKPDPAFLPSKTEPHDHITHNPPPSMPNVYHTPTLFLPKGDKRRLLLPKTPTPLIGNDPKLLDIPPGQLPPAVQNTNPKKYHLTEADFEEMRKLRREDPWKWSVIQLAKKFDCSRLIVMSATNGIAREKRQVQKQLTDAIKSNWGSKRTIAREDRQLRKEKWFADS